LYGEFAGDRVEKLVMRLHKEDTLELTTAMDARGTIITNQLEH
jgi:hypothetical protein